MNSVIRTFATWTINFIGFAIANGWLRRSDKRIIAWRKALLAVESAADEDVKWMFVEADEARREAMKAQRKTWTN